MYWTAVRGHFGAGQQTTTKLNGVHRLTGYTYNRIGLSADQSDKQSD